MTFFELIFFSYLGTIIILQTRSVHPTVHSVRQAQSYSVYAANKLEESIETWESKCKNCEKEA